MGKTPKVKKRSKSFRPLSFSSTNLRLDVSLHSRAARRATSPSLNTDKSLKNITPPDSTSTPHPAMLSAQNAGISKKKRQKPLSRQQRLRQRKGVARADAVSDKLEKKVAKSLGSKKNIKERSKAWEEIDGKIRSGKPAKGDENDGMSVDEEEAVDGVEKPTEKPDTAESAAIKAPIEAAGSGTPGPNAPEAGPALEADEDEIL